MIFKYPFKAFVVALILIIFNGPQSAFAQTSQTKATTQPVNKAKKTPAAIIAVGGRPGAPTVQSPNFSYPTPAPYPINVPITPIGPANTGGAVPATVFGSVSTIAGSRSTAGYTDATGADARFTNLQGIDVDASGNLFVVDNGDRTRIRKITPTGVVTTFAGGSINPTANGVGTAAGFNGGTGLVVAPSGNIFVGDVGNNSIREITPGALVSTFGGTGITTFNPAGLTTDQAGNLFVTDQLHDLIWKFTTAGASSVYAGREDIQGAVNGAPPTSATFSREGELKFDRNGNLFIADNVSNQIRKITPAGVVSTFAGTFTPGLVNGAIANARFSSPNGLAIDKVNNIYIADAHKLVVRMINILGNALDIAGNNSRRVSLDGVEGEANFYSIGGLVYSNGAVYATDQTCVRKLIVTGYTIDKVLPFGLTFDSQTGIISGTPIALSLPIQYTITGYNQGGVFSNTVTISVVPPAPPIISYSSPQIYTTNTAITSLSPVSTGGLVAHYTGTLPAGLTVDNITGSISGTPTVVSPAADYTITATNDGGSGTAVIKITVIAQVLQPQTITFGPNTKTYGDADFAPGASSTNSTIPITYTSDNISVATIVNGKIHINGAGQTNITASQAGNNTYSEATPVTQILTVNPAPLTITADDKTKPVGSLNPPLTATYSGLVYGETPSYLVIAPIITTSATESSPVGLYPIIVSGGSSPNYTITYVPGNLTITAVLPAIVVPNTFTPNGDGINDVWNINALVAYPQCLVSVYNRYGSMVYQSKGYTKPWDGTYGGAQVPPGTYYYIIDPKNGTKQLSGYILVLR